MIKKRNNRKKRSRRGSFHFFVLLFLLLFIGILLLGSYSTGRFGVFHQLTLEALGPVQGFFTKISLGTSKFTDEYIRLWNLQKTNDQLRLELDVSREKVDKYRAAYSKYRFLEAALEFKKQNSLLLLTARVVGKDPSFWFQTLIVDRGKNDGVVIGMVARTYRGVVGQVVQVADNYSKVLLANAPSSAIDALVQSSRVRGILKGAGEQGYTLQYVQRKPEVKVGDVIVTAGIGGVFPSGIPLGTVSKVNARRRGMFVDVLVEPAVDFSRLEFLFINLSEEHLLIDELINSAETAGE